MRAPSVVFLVPGLSVGGAERHTVDLRSRLERRGFATALLVHGPRRSPAMLAHPGAAGAVHLDIRGMSQLRGWVRVARALRRTDPDIVVAINQTPLIVAVLTRFLMRQRTAVACIFHTTVLRPQEHRAFFLFRWALRAADALVFVSSNQKRYWEKRRLVCRAAPVIRNGIDCVSFGPLYAARGEIRAHLGLAQADFVIGLVAAFRPEKNHIAAVDALDLLRRRGVAAKLLLVGDGATRGDVEARVRERGLSDAVRFAGEQEDVRPFIAACDVGVLPSMAVETLSLSALEFLASGVPMVMSRIGGAAEIVEDGVNGFLFDVGDTPGLAERLERLADPLIRCRLSEAARPSAEYFGIEAMVDAYVDLFGKLTRI